MFVLVVLNFLLQSVSVCTEYIAWKVDVAVDMQSVN